MRKRTPSYRLHKPSGLAVVTIDGKDIYLGPYGSVESRIKYGEAIARADGSPTTAPKTRLTLHELVVAYMEHANSYYVKNGNPTSEIECIKLGTRPLLALYGNSPADDFGPLKLRSVRQLMIDEKNLCRRTINKTIGRIRSIFRWGVSHEMVPASVLNSLEAVEPLKRGRTEARDPVKRRPVADTSIARVKKLVPERTADLIDLQLLCGARPGELLMLTSGMIDRTGDIWFARLADHKTVHHDQERVLVFGPRAQLILRKYITLDHSRKLFPIRRDTYGKAVKAACEKLGIPVWTPHWLRHNAASKLREEYGLDVAQAMLGHASADMTQLYAHLNITKAAEVARQVG